MGDKEVKERETILKDNNPPQDKGTIKYVLIAVGFAVLYGISKVIFKI